MKRTLLFCVHKGDVHCQVRSVILLLVFKFHVNSVATDIITTCILSDIVCFVSVQLLICEGISDVGKTYSFDLKIVNRGFLYHCLLQNLLILAIRLFLGTVEPVLKITLSGP